MGCSGHIFLAAPSPLSLLLFRLLVVSISSIGFAFVFFLCFLGEVAGAATAGVFGVDLVDAAAEVVVVGVAGAGVGVASGSGVAATSAVAADEVFF